jgi:pimeloyl-ACP methyl ester carboxylesterase
MLFARNKPRYARKPPLVLINGLAEQAESWYCNLDAWRWHFDVHTPNLLAYDGTALQQRIDAGLPIDIGYLVEQLRLYVDCFVQRPPVHLVANSMGGKIAVEFCVRHPQLVGRLALLSPAGLSEEERLPMVEGVRRNDPRSLIDSVFHDARHADPNLLDYYLEKFASRKWRGGMMRTLRGTMTHRVADVLHKISQPTLLVVGERDRIVSPEETMASAQRLLNGRIVAIPDCGHAPQIERAEFVNQLVIDFLRGKERMSGLPIPRDRALPA